MEFSVSCERGRRLASWVPADLQSIDFGKGFIAILAVAVFALLILWLLVPFVVFAIERRVFNILCETRRASELLAYLVQTLSPAQGQAGSSSEETQVEQSESEDSEASDESDASEELAEQEAAADEDQDAVEYEQAAEDEQAEDSGAEESYEEEAEVEEAPPAPARKVAPRRR